MGMNNHAGGPGEIDWNAVFSTLGAGVAGEEGGVGGSGGWREDVGHLGQPQQHQQPQYQQEQEQDQHQQAYHFQEPHQHAQFEQTESPDPFPPLHHLPEDRDPGLAVGLVPPPFHRHSSFAYRGHGHGHGHGHEDHNANPTMLGHAHMISTSLPSTPSVPLAPPMGGRSTLSDEEFFAQFSHSFHAGRILGIHPSPLIPPLPSFPSQLPHASSSAGASAGAGSGAGGGGGGREGIATFDHHPPTLSEALRSQLSPVAQDFQSRLQLQASSSSGGGGSTAEFNWGQAPPLPAAFGVAAGGGTRATAASRETNARARRGRLTSGHGRRRSSPQGELSSEFVTPLLFGVSQTSIQC